MNKKIIILTDGRPGHETQSIGIAKLLNSQNEYLVKIIKIQSVEKMIKQLFKSLYRILPKNWMLDFYFNADFLQGLKQCHEEIYIVSAGGDTLVPNALLKAYLKGMGISVQNIIATSLRGMPESAYDVIFSIDQKKKNQQPYLYYPIAPNKLLSFDLLHEQQLAKQHLNIDHQQLCYSVLIGADTQDVHIGDASDWVNFIQQLYNRYVGQRIVVTTSRRTALNFEQHLLQAFQHYQNIELVLVAHGEVKNIKDIIYASEVVFCSPDSTSMISESLIANKTVIIPLFENSFLNKKFSEHYWDLSRRDLALFMVDADNFSEFSVEPTAHIQHAQALANLFNQALQN